MAGAGQAEAGTTEDSRPFLDVEDLRVTFSTPDGVIKAVDGVSFSLRRGQTLGVVGESGSGKTAMSLAVLGLQTGRTAEGLGPHPAGRRGPGRGPEVTGP